MPVTRPVSSIYATGAANSAVQRGVSSPRRAVGSAGASSTLAGNYRPPNSSDAILSDLITSFQDKIFVVVRRRTETILTRYMRLNYLSREDRSVLESCRQQCESFLNGMESVIRSCVRRSEGGGGAEGMEISVVKRGFDLWKQCNDLASQITVVLETKASRQQASAALETIGARGSPLRSSDTSLASNLANQQQQQLYDELRALQQLRHVDKTSAQRIYALFIALHGKDKGHVEFVAWMSLLPPQMVDEVAAAVL